MGAINGLMADRYRLCINLHRPAAMHLRRGFGDADIVGNRFCSGGRAPLE